MNDQEVVESSIQLSRPIRCPLCSWPTKYVDRLDSGDLCCIACTYIEGFPMAAGAMTHELGFIPEDPYFLSAILRVSSHNLQSGKTATLNTKVSKKTLQGLADLAKKHRVHPRVEVETALAWYVAAVEGRGIQKNIEQRLSQLEKFEVENATESSAEPPRSVRAHSWKEDLPRPRPATWKNETPAFETPDQFQGSEEDDETGP